MQQQVRGWLAGLTFILAVAGCADSAEQIVAPVTETAELRASGTEQTIVTERAALAELGRRVAISLGDRQLRQTVKRHMRAAPLREHKLDLNAYLKGANGKQLAEKMAGRNGRSDAVLTLLGKIRPLEFYMPVRRHRDTWVGDAEVLVAVQLEEDDPIIAFNSRGQQIALDRSTAPVQPTLSIVPAETRFNHQMSVGSKNIDDSDGEAIGTLLPASFKISHAYCAGCVAEDGGGEGGGGGGGAGGGSGAVEPGLYLEFSRILDVHEPWTKGEPEIEVHIHGPTDQGNPRIGKDLSCSGQHAYDPRKAFDQNEGFWEGSVMLFSDAEVERFNSQFNDGFHVLYWEDDDTECVLKLDNDSLLEFLRSSAQAFGTAAVKIIKPGTPWYLVAGPFLATLFHNAGEWLRTNDDFVGALVAADAAGYGSTYPNNTHVIKQGTQLNGRATLIYR